MTAVDERPSWCVVDQCPSFICGGPHREVLTTMGTEILRYDQAPIGTPVEPPDDRL